MNRDNHDEVQNKLDWDLTFAIKENDVENVRRLLDQGADPNNMHVYPRITPLILAARESSDIVQSLIDHRADVNYSTLPLSWAVRSPRADSIVDTLLRNGARVNDNMISNAITPDLRDRLVKAQNWQSREPYLSLVEGTPDATGHIDKYLSNEVAQRNIAEMIPPGDTSGGKKSRKQRRKIRKSRKSRKSRKHKHRRR
jgi:hypothetical protein